MTNVSGQVGARVAIVTSSANPYTTGSVPMIGFKIAASLSRIASTVLVFHARDRNLLTEALLDQRLVFAGSSLFARALRRVSTTLFPGRWNFISIFDFFDYILFDAHTFLILRRLVRRGEIDCVLRVNPISPRFPSLLPRLPVPVFTGPHNGGMRWPPGFRHLEGKERTGQRLRFLGDLAHATYGDLGHYSGIFVAHEMCAQTIPRAHRDKLLLLSENGVDGVKPLSPHAGDASRLLFVGRLTPFKAVDVVIRALARLPEQVHLTVVGGGSQRAELETLAARLSVRERCRFEGERPHSEVDEYYAEAGVFVFPSVRESGGAVVLEAMSHGLPCLVADWGGPPIYTRDTGLHLRVDSPTALEDDLVMNLRRLLEHPEEAREIGRRSREVIDGEYVWSSKAELLYRTMLRVMRENDRDRRRRPGRPRGRG